MLITSCYLLVPRGNWLMVNSGWQVVIYNHKSEVRSDLIIVEFVFIVDLVWVTSRKFHQQTRHMSLKLFDCFSRTVCVHVTYIMSLIGIWSMRLCRHGYEKCIALIEHRKLLRSRRMTVNDHNQISDRISD